MDKSNEQGNALFIPLGSKMSIQHDNYPIRSKILLGLFAVSAFIGGNSAINGLTLLPLAAISCIFVTVLFSILQIFRRSLWPFWLCAVVLGLVWIASYIFIPPSLKDLILESYEISGESRNLILGSTNAFWTSGFQGLGALSLFLAAVVAFQNREKYFLYAILALALISALLGVFQFSSGGSVLNFYRTPHITNAPGIFANRNHTALFASIAISIALFFVFRRDRSEKDEGSSSPFALWWIVVAFLFVHVLATSSRAGLALAFASILLTTAFFYPMDRKGKLRFGVGSLVAIGSLYGLTQIPRVQDVLSRYDTVTEDGRWFIWAESWDRLVAYWPRPIGSMMYQDVMIITETPEDIKPYLLNHAHNEYIEWLLEFGIMAPVVFLAFCLVIFASFRFTKRSNHSNSTQKLGLIWILLILGHSIVDYPLRVPTLGLVFAIALSFIAARPLLKSSVHDGH